MKQRQRRVLWRKGRAARNGPPHRERAAVEAGILADVKDRGKLAETSKKDWGSEKIAMRTARAVYVWMPQGVIKSKLNAAVSKALGDGVTSRNWTTMLKLKEMTEEVRAGIR